MEYVHVGRRHFEFMVFSLKRRNQNICLVYEICYCKSGITVIIREKLSWIILICLLIDTIYWMCVCLFVCFPAGHPSKPNFTFIVSVPTTFPGRCFRLFLLEEEAMVQRDYFTWWRLHHWTQDLNVKFSSASKSYFHCMSIAPQFEYPVSSCCCLYLYPKYLTQHSRIL